MKNRYILQSSLLSLLALSLSACEVKDSPTDSHSPEAAEAETKMASTNRDITGLDVLTDYNRDIWGGPDAWNEEQWQWKKTLGWNRECDYVGNVETINLNEQLQLVTVQCVPGSFQPMSYLYLYDKDQAKSKPLELGTADTSESPQEVWGKIDYNSSQKELSILTLSRGLGDCGTYRSFQLSELSFVEDTKVSPQATRRRDCEDHGGKDFDQLPKDIFNHKLWPVVK